jgi:hypothetical protein
VDTLAGAGMIEKEAAGQVAATILAADDIEGTAAEWIQKQA